MDFAARISWRSPMRCTNNVAEVRQVTFCFPTLGYFYRISTFLQFFYNQNTIREVATLRRKMNGWSCQAQAQKNMQVCILCSTSQFVQWLHQAQVIWTNSFGQCLSHFVGQESVANKQSILPCIRPNQRYTKYSGSASSDRRGCRYFSFSHSGLSLYVAHLEIRSSLDTGERIRSRTHFISITTCTLDIAILETWNLTSSQGLAVVEDQALKLCLKSSALAFPLDLSHSRGPFYKRYPAGT